MLAGGPVPAALPVVVDDRLMRVLPVEVVGGRSSRCMGDPPGSRKVPRCVALILADLSCRPACSSRVGSTSSCREAVGFPGRCSGA